MSIFSYPRIHVQGLVEINVGTGNNDDYSSDAFPPGSKFEDQPLRLSDSDHVQAVTYEMNDADWIAWVQNPAIFLKPEDPSDAKTKAVTPEVPGALDLLIPAEWNYYGDMTVRMLDVNVVSVRYRDHLASGDGADPLIGSQLSFNNRPDESGKSTAMMIDINAEDVPCSQIFADFLMLEKDGHVVFSGKPSKAATRWINFQRNTNLKGSAGAGCCMQSVVELADIADQPIMTIFKDAGVSKDGLRGLVFRYYICRSLPRINPYRYAPADYNQMMQGLYANKGTNPAYLELIGTIAPWYDGEMRSVPTGRLLLPQSAEAVVPVQGAVRQAGQRFRLGPAVLRVDYAQKQVSVDVSGTFPDSYQNPAYEPRAIGGNPKYNFGPVMLKVGNRGAEREIGAINYLEPTAAANGWIIDFDLTDADEGLWALIKDGAFLVRHELYGALLSESSYFVASDQSCLVAEQTPAAPSISLFVNDGYPEGEATVRVFSKDGELSAAECPEVKVWEYRATPNNASGSCQLLPYTVKPGDAIQLEATQSGNRLITFTLGCQTDPPTDYGKLDVMCTPLVNVRILPNDKDFSEFYVDPDVPDAVGNAALTFDVIFKEILHNYYLLYPAMNARVPLNSAVDWEGAVMAAKLLRRVSKALWSTSEYMPRTRDLSASRRRLLQAWCRKYIA